MAKRSARPSSDSVTASDVAHAAGVSLATVSRVLNGNTQVGEELRAKVVSAAEALGYTPHAAARALASQRTTTVGAIIPTLEDPNFAVGVASLQKHLAQAGYTLLLASSNYDPAEELRQARALAAHGVAAMMLVGAHRQQAVYELLAARRIPFVNTWVLDSAHPCVGFDNRLIGHTLASYLLDLGHTRFGIIAQTSPNSDRAAERIAGIRAALSERGVRMPEAHLIERSHRIADGQFGLRTLMASSKPPTAVICGTDTLAFGAMVEARAQSLRVPADLSITGINDVEFAAHLAPPLTTIQLSAEEIGERAAQYLLARLGGRPALQATPVPFTLIVRGSTGAPRAS